MNSMDNNLPTSDNSVVVSLLSDSNFLSLSILENILSKKCFVNVITSDVGNWKEKTQPLSANSRFSILDENTSVGVHSTYSIVVVGFGRKDPYEELNDILSKKLNSGEKILILLPFEKYSPIENSRFNFNANLGVIYLGDILGARMTLNNNLLVTAVINEIYFKRTLHFAVGEVLYPLFVNDVAKTVSRWLFSFGPYGKETLLLGPQTSTTAFWKENTLLAGEIKMEYMEGAKTRVIPTGMETTIINTNIKLLLNETYKWIAKFPPSENQSTHIGDKWPYRKTNDILSNIASIVKTPRKEKSIAPVRQKKQNTLPPKPKVKKVYPKYFKPLVYSLLLIILFPVLMLIISASAFYISYKQFVSGNDTGAQNTMLIAKTFSVMSKEESKVLSYLPLVGAIYKEFSFASYLGEKVSEMSTSAVPLIRNSSELMSKVLGNEIYDPGVFAPVITGHLDSLFRQISLMEIDTKEAVSHKGLVAKFFMNKVDLDKYKNLTLQAKILSQNLPELLGKNGSKSYLLLFQNNMELRPTGGFIGSFGILTFDGGRIADLTVNDVYSADGQLNGHVEPPAPIKKYLGEANWWLRDSNWDPDFPTSAKRAEWFLDKEMGRSVDGVVGIDLDPIKKILSYTGPVFLSDFNMDITSENLYEKTQAEVQGNFFPGTRKKASFLTALSRNLLANVSKLGTMQKIGILKSFYLDLEGRSIQVFLHDENSREAISALRWDGGVATPECGQGCFADQIGTVEANLGVNKTNYFIERQENLDITLSGGKIIRTLKVNLKNKANPALGASSVYKTYVRLLSDPKSTVTSARLITGQSSQDLTMDLVNLKGRNETGVYVEIIGGQSKTLEYTWISDAGTDFGYYGLYFRKQAGTGPDPVSLTVNGVNVYNGLLTGDVFSRVNWK